MPEWLKGAGCKPAGLRLRRFESYSLQRFFILSAAQDEKPLSTEASAKVDKALTKPKSPFLYFSRPRAAEEE